MDCSICRQGATQPGTTTVTLERGDMVIVIKDVPAEVCENCGEYFLSEATTEEVMRRGELAAESGVELQVLRYAA